MHAFASLVPFVLQKVNFPLLGFPTKWNKKDKRKKRLATKCKRLNICKRVKLIISITVLKCFVLIKHNFNYIYLYIYSKFILFGIRDNHQVKCKIRHNSSNIRLKETCDFVVKSRSEMSIS